jgi:hypothetical protein
MDVTLTSVNYELKQKILKLNGSVTDSNFAAETNVSFDCYDYPSNRTAALSSTQRLTEMSAGCE